MFLDDQLRPLPDDLQWSHLAAIPTIGRRTVEPFVGEAVGKGSVIGVRAREAAETEEAEPWDVPPSRRRTVRISGPLPSRIRAVLSQRLFVEEADLPSPVVNEIRRLAAFENPEFHKKQSMRLSTALTPRVISCAEDMERYVALPRGCRPDLEALLREHKVTLDLDDKREEEEPIRASFHGELTPVQVQAARALLEHDTGVFVAPPGVGTTVVGVNVIAERGRSTLVLVHRRPSLDQWRAQLALFFGIEPKAIGQLGAGEHRPNGTLDVAMIQSLVHGGKVADLVGRYVRVIVDECHHVPAVSFERVLGEAKARFVVGLTATPQRRDGLHPIIEMQLGPVRSSVDSRSEAARRPFEQRLVVRETSFHDPARARTPTIQELYGALAADKTRNEMILDDVIASLEEGRSPIVLTERKDHPEFFAERLQGFTPHLVVLHGGMSARARKATMASLAANVLGLEVVVDGFELTREESIVAVCRRSRSRQAVPILELPIPKPPPRGVEWVEAYRRWVRGR